MIRISYGTACLGASAILIAFGAGAGTTTAHQKDDPAAVEFFELKVRPVLVEKCMPCHGTKQQAGGLRLDTSANMMRGNSAGPAAVAGDPDRSPIIQAVRYDGKVKMPPSGPLKPEEVQALTAWVKSGAKWPGSDQKATPSAADKAKLWGFQPVQKFAPPKVKAESWVRQPLDKFVLAKLEAAKLTPAPHADRRSLIRRAYLDLIGLPPTAEEVDAFIKDSGSDAYSKIIDNLLANKQYGERWARLWLDVARFADTRGYNFVDERVYKDAYTYRDYVIRAFNEDKPYDRFVMEQIAGDQLSNADNPAPRAAMGFLTVGRRFLNNIHDIIDDRIDVVSRGFMGLTLNCARCHDHKFDPLSARDYYSFYSVFANSSEPNPPLTISPPEVAQPWEKHNSELRAAEKERTDTLQAQIRRLRRMVTDDAASVPKPIKDALQGFRVGTLPTDAQYKAIAPGFEEKARKRIDLLAEQITLLQRSQPKAPEFAMAMVDNENIAEHNILLRGNPSNPGPRVARRFLAVLNGDDSKPFKKGSGRLELAQSIVAPDNPFTARVIVNRIWRHHFGQGIVRTPSDFGTRGEPPTHPEMLDYLASKFMEEGWSIKKLHRTIMLSSTYQQSSEVSPKAAIADPENRLISHFQRRRMDLEQMRDSLLYVSGRLDNNVGGPSVDILTQPFSNRRSLYGFIDRQNLPGFFRTFDLASPDASSPGRFSTVVPQQALFMMNSPFMRDLTHSLATRKELADSLPDRERIEAAYRIALGRMPNTSEVALGVAYLAKGPKTVALTDAKKEPTPWELYLQTLLMTNEFAFID